MSEPEMRENPRAVYDRLCEHARQTALLASTEALLGWDERTMMPAAGGPYRAAQLALLAGLIHERRTDPRVGEWLAAVRESPLAAAPHSVTGANIRELGRRYERQTRLPRRLVEELARATTVGQQAWQAARERDDFASFEPHLEKIVRLKWEEADCLGFADTPYDPLLDEYEPGETTAHVASVLAALRDELVPFVAAIQASGRRAEGSILTRRFPVDAQDRFARLAAERLGFDFERGRLDVTAHPFCTELGPDDTRICTRFDEHFFPAAFFGVLHEAGHGLYEQHLDREQHGLPAGAPVSLGIHESQSRLWENHVGRSHAFWEHLYPDLRTAFPGVLDDVGLDAFHFAVNEVRPSLIRVEADEATYNLHILARFELEQALVAGELAVGDLPAAWREKYARYLGVTPPDDRQGVLQDIHWGAGLLGYFPTYTLGNLYAAQFLAAAAGDLGDLHEQFRHGELAPLRTWLTEKIHRRGCRYPAPRLVEEVTGEPLSHAPLMAHLRRTLAPLYGL